MNEAYTFILQVLGLFESVLSVLLAQPIFLIIFSVLLFLTIGSMLYWLIYLGKRGKF